MIEVTVEVKPLTAPFAGVWVYATIDLNSAKQAITDSILRDSLTQRVAEDVQEALWAYFNSPQGREEVWNLDASTRTATPTAQG